MSNGNRVSQRKIVVVKAELNGDSSFDQVISLHFVPDDMIVRSLCLRPAVTFDYDIQGFTPEENGDVYGVAFAPQIYPVQIHSTITNGFLEFSLTGTLSNPQTQHVLNKAILGAQSFTLLGSDGNAYAFSGEIMLTL